MDDDDDLSDGESSRQDEQINNEARQLVARLQGVLPFCILFLLKYIYLHAVGLTCFVGWSVLIVYLDKKWRLQVSLKEEKENLALFVTAVMSFLGIITVYTIAFVVGDRKAYQRLALIPLDQKTPPTVEEVLWGILVSDVVVRLLSILIKCVAAILPYPHALLPRRPSVDVSSSGGGSNYHQAAEDGMALLEESRENAGGGTRGEGPMMGMSIFTRKKRLYALIEMFSLSYRTILPVSLWAQFYSSDNGYGRVFVGIYVALKAMVLSQHCRSLVVHLQSLLSGQLEHGKYVTQEEVLEATGSHECPICYSVFANPVMIPCNHAFCENCIQEWLDRERSCPICRANCPSNNAAAGDGNGPMSINNISNTRREVGTPPWPCIL